MMEQASITLFRRPRARCACVEKTQVVAHGAMDFAGVVPAAQGVAFFLLVSWRLGACSWESRCVCWVGRRGH